MGGRSNKSQQDTNTNVDYQDRTFSNQDGVVATEGAVLSNTTNTTTNTNVLDAGAIKAATQLVSETISSNATGLNAAYGFANGVTKAAISEADNVLLSAQIMSEKFGVGVKDITQNLTKLTVTAVSDTAKDAMQASATAARESIAANQETYRDAMAYSNGVNLNLAKTYDSAIGMTASMSSRVMDALMGANKESNSVAANAITQVNRAWDSAKTAEKDLAGGDYRQLMIIGAAIIGLVAVMGMKK
jgi:hypothetical protein